MEKVGLIGCGAMGSGIAYSLCNKEYDVRILDYKNNKNVELLLKSGAKFVSMQTLVEESNFIILCLSDASAVENVVFSKDGLLKYISSKKVLIDTTTSQPDTTEKIYKILKERNIEFADAPLTRSPVEAMEGRLNTLVGAENKTFKKIQPILSAFCENIIHIGDVGSGHKIKLLNNFICMSFTAIVEYGMYCGKCLNIDIKMLDKVMSFGSNYVSSIPAMLKFIDEDNKEVLNFSIKNATKDMKYFFDSINFSDCKKWFEPLYHLYYDASIDEEYKGKTLPFIYDFLRNNDEQNNKEKRNRND